MNYWETKINKEFTEITERNEYKYQHLLKNISDKISKIISNYNDYDFKNVEIDIIKQYESFCISIFMKNIKIYFECFPYSSDDVFESLLIIENIENGDILEAQTNTINNILYNLNIYLNKNQNI